MTISSFQFAGLCSALVFATLIGSGCASTQPNPSAAKPHTGYVDFYSPESDGLAWEVREAKTGGDFKTVFSDLKPAEHGVARLALAPGRYQLRVTVLNRVIVKPADAEVEVQDGRITPVRTTLSEAGPTTVKSKEITRGTARATGPVGGHTKISADETMRYDLSATADSPVDYQPKERMAYAR